MNVYLDNAATTKPNDAALTKAVQYAQNQFYNPSALYGGGICVHNALQKAREELLSHVAKPRDFRLIFTSGGTEADNQALFCGAKRGNLVVGMGEHAAVYQSALKLKERLEVRFAPIDGHGAVKRENLLSLVDENTAMVCVMHVNNETGAVNDILSLSKEVKRKNPRTLFFSDGVQAYGKIPITLSSDIDFYSISAHKIGGLKGTGALIVKKSIPLSPFLYGGGQEGNLRSGTENILGIQCFYYAAQDKFQNIKEDYARVGTLREELFSLLDQDIFYRVSPENGSPYLLSVSARGLRGEILQRLLEERGVIVGTGSACSSKHPYSRVIMECGLSNDILSGVLRLSFSNETTKEQIEYAADALNKAAYELKGKL